DDPIAVVDVERGPELTVAQREVDDSDPDLRQALLPDRQALGLERHEQVVAYLVLQTLGEQQGVHRRIEQRRVEAVAARGLPRTLGQRRLGPYLLADVPGLLDALEARAVAVTEGGEVGVQGGRVERLGARRRQGDRRVGAGVAVRGDDRAGRVQLPLAVLAFRRAVDLNRAALARGRADRDLQAG